MDTTFSTDPGHSGHTHPHPQLTVGKYLALLAALFVASIPIGFVLLHIALHADGWIHTRERRRLLEERAARRIQHEQEDEQGQEDPERDLERNAVAQGIFEDRIWGFHGVTESSCLLPSVLAEPASSDS
ncbi:hypothetical protein PGQ11_014592 [Apiospora arundinis]|uniref:Uncharacterized protein n=1 Tax=Apiospora arundinis TaxID=335852 RepID=A0ABR2HTA0_9PEZI